MDNGNEVKFDLEERKHKPRGKTRKFLLRLAVGEGGGGIRRIFLLHHEN
jgi:hypothetical protein